MGEGIEKPWGIYGSFMGPWGIGKITMESEARVDILYSERQLYPPQWWDPKWVDRFNSLEEAVEHYIKKTNAQERGFSDSEIREQSRGQFPSYFEEKIT